MKCNTKHVYQTFEFKLEQEVLASTGEGGGRYYAIITHCLHNTPAMSVHDIFTTSINK